MFYPGFPGDRAGGKTYGLIFIRESAPDPQGAGMAARAAEGGGGEKSPSQPPHAPSQGTLFREAFWRTDTRGGPLCARERKKTIASSLPFLLGQKFASQVGINSTTLAVVPA